MSEGTDALEEVMGILRSEGINVQFAWQVPDVIRQLVGQPVTGGSGFGQSQVGIAPPPPRALPGPGVAGYPQPGAHRQPAAAVQTMMRQPQRTAPTPQAPPRPSPSMLEEDRPIDQGIVGDLFDEFGDPDLEQEEAPPALDSMLAEVQAGQARMMKRVATQGVKYGGGMPSPAAGKKLVPHPSTPRKLIEATSPPPTEDELDGMDLGVPGFGEELVEAEEGQDYAPGDERVDPKTGQTIGEKRRIMQQILGRPITPPTPGIPNTGVTMSRK